MASSTSALRQHASPDTAGADLPLGFVRDQATLQRTLSFLSRRLTVANLTQRQARTLDALRLAHARPSWLASLAPADTDENDAMPRQPRKRPRDTYEPEEPEEPEELEEHEEEFEQEGFVCKSSRRGAGDVAISYRVKIPSSPRTARGRCILARRLHAQQRTPRNP